MKTATPAIVHLTIHDYFDGTAHCRECKGYCTLPQAEKLLGELIRNVLEHHWRANKGWLPLTIESTLRNILGDHRLRDFQERAANTT